MSVLFGFRVLPIAWICSFCFGRRGYLWKNVEKKVITFITLYTLHCTILDIHFLTFKLIWYIFHWRLCESTRNENTTSPTGVKMYDWVAWFARFQWFSYLGMGFQLLSIDLTLKFWHSVYYIGHLVLPIFGLIGLTVFKTALNFVLPSSSRHQKEDIKTNWFHNIYDNIIELCFLK